MHAKPPLNGLLAARHAEDQARSTNRRIISRIVPQPEQALPPSTSPDHRTKDSKTSTSGRVNKVHIERDHTFRCLQSLPVINAVPAAAPHTGL
jgi:hypothetical protein